MNKKWNDISEFLTWIGIVVCLNILLSQFFFRVDLTEDKRYSLAPVTKKFLENLNDKVYVDVYLAGPMDSDYERLEKAVREKLDEFRVFAKNGLEYRFFDPNTIQDKRIRENFYAQLMRKGLKYRYYLQEEGGKKEEKIIFPGALILYGDREVPVMFLKGKKALPLQKELNQAVEGVEFELASGLRKISVDTIRNVAFLEGHGELPKEEVSDISGALFDFYNVSRIKLNDSVDLNSYTTLILAKPTQRFSEEDKLLLDQYLMNGGNLLVLADALNEYEDSLVSGVTYALPYDLNLEDLFFRYGFRLNESLIQDKFSGVIPVMMPGEQMQVIPYPFYPVLYNFTNVPVVKNLDAVLTRFIGTIDTVKADGVNKIPLLKTSPDTRVFQAPIQISLNTLRKNSAPSLFNAGQLTVGYLLEGTFASLYKNRPLPFPYKGFRETSLPAKIIVVPDGDVIRNDYDPETQKPFPLGYDVNMRYLFSNKEFIMNAVDYLSGADIIQARAKEVKMRPLNKEMIYESRLKWQIINLVVPVVLLILFGIVRYFLRKKKYASF